MRQFLKWTALALLVMAFAGCTGPQYTAAPCGGCKWGAKNTQGPMEDPVAYCVVEGKKVDCKKVPPECPECAKKTDK